MQERKRRERKNVARFGGVYSEKENAALWGAVRTYEEREYRTKRIEKIFFRSGGGSWMKKGVEMLGADRLSRLRIYWKNGGDMPELVRSGKKARPKEAPEEACFSAADLLA